MYRGRKRGTAAPCGVVGSLNILTVNRYGLLFLVVAYQTQSNGFIP
jgi:hypothetical protein